MALIVGVFYYVSTLRNQNRARQAQLLYQMHNISPSHVIDDYFPVISTKISGFQEYQEKMESDVQFRKVFGAFWNWYEVLGVFVKAGYLDIHVVALMWASLTKTYYENIVEPIIDDLREFYGYPRAGSEGEYVCKTLIAYLEQHPELKT